MKLPNVFANSIDKKINNNVEYYRGDRNIVNRDLSELKKYFDNTGYVNKLSVSIKTKNGIIDSKLILCRNSYFVDINNNKIYFDDIIDYEVK